MGSRRARLRDRPRGSASVAAAGYVVERGPTAPGRDPAQRKINRASANGRQTVALRRDRGAKLAKSILSMVAVRSVSA